LHGAPVDRHAGGERAVADLGELDAQQADDGVAMDLRELLEGDLAPEDPARGRACGWGVGPGALPAGVAGSTLPGLSRPCGSSACLIARIIAISTGDL
jgi:hypothetical protein